MSERAAGLDEAAALARRWLESLDQRPVAQDVDPGELRTSLGGPLEDHGTDPKLVIEELVALADPGLVASPGPRYFGFVVGGAHPAALAADWLTSAWDQNASFQVMSPAAAAIEEVTAGWVLDLLGLPAEASVGFVTGAQGANTTCLAAARNAVFRRAGWDVERDGLQGAPRVNVVCGEQAHVTIGASLRLLGLGAETAISVPADEQGRMRADALAEALAPLAGPTIVCAQAGNVNSGAFDPFGQIADACATHGAWLHVDGAFGLWAAAAESTKHLTAGAERADSWGVDAHKWLNVPYDSAMAIVRDREAHAAAMGLSASYLQAGAARDGTNFVPEASRRSRAVTVYAVLRALGRQGLAELIERNCAQARRMAERMAAIEGCEVLNDVVLNQVLVRFPGDDDANAGTIAAIQRDGTCWLGGTQWQGRHVARISFSNWSTTSDDVDRSADAIAAAIRSVGA
jgi:glutamate/tyrosine decarboxylase-like PLP-dependent enzyme